MTKNLYEILGINKNSSTETIKKAYRDLALKYHPDKNQHDPKCEQRMKEINKARDILCDEQKRRVYDSTGKLPEEMPQNSFASQQHEFLKTFLFSQQRQPITENVLVLTPYEITKGCKKEITVKKTKYLDEHGNAATEILCSCNRTAGMGFIFFTMNCTQCNNTRKIYPPGTKKIDLEETVEIDVPENSWPGRICSVKSFDVLLKIKLDEDQRFENNSLIIIVKRNIFSLLANNEITINPCGTEITFTPNNIKPFYIFYNEGIYTQNGERCNLTVKFDIIYPTLTDEEKEICEELNKKIANKIKI